jgi:hypothetical protein
MVRSPFCKVQRGREVQWLRGSMVERFRGSTVRERGKERFSGSAVRERKMGLGGVPIVLAGVWYDSEMKPV